MKRLVLGMIGVLAVASVVWAQEPTVVENPSNAWLTFKRVVDVLQPGYETIYDFRGGEWFQGFSASLYNLSSQDIYLASLRAGYAIDQKAYGGVKLNLPGIAQRYVPATIKGIATAGPLDIFWRVAGKYGSVGLITGYDWDNRHIITGITLGGQIAF